MMRQASLSKSRSSLHLLLYDMYHDGKNAYSADNRYWNKYAADADLYSLSRVVVCEGDYFTRQPRWIQMKKKNEENKI